MKHKYRGKNHYGNSGHIADQPGGAYSGQGATRGAGNSEPTRARRKTKFGSTRTR